MSSNSACMWGFLNCVVHTWLYSIFCICQPPLHCFTKLSNAYIFLSNDPCAKLSKTMFFCWVASATKQNTCFLFLGSHAKTAHRLFDPRDGKQYWAKPIVSIAYDVKHIKHHELMFALVSHTTRGRNLLSLGSSQNVAKPFDSHWLASLGGVVMPPMVG